MTKGDKQMLIDTIRDAYREMTGNFVQAEPVITVPAHRPAANSGSIAKAEMQARRHRRQRRLERAERGGINGWTVRTW
jgi:hypothetical protein